MGRHKTRNKHLPPRMRQIKGRYYWIGYRDGKRPSIPLGDDYPAALLRWREIEGLTDSAATVAAIIDRYLARAEVADVTRTGYIEQSVPLKAFFEGARPQDVQPRHIRQYLDRRPRTAGAREVALFSAAWNHARETGLIDLPNPREGIRIKGAKKVTRTAAPAQQTSLTEGNSQMAVICELAFLTGLRQTDIRMLRLDAIDDARGLVVTPSKTQHRTGATLVFEWTPALRACIARAKLLRRRVGSVYVFPNRQGQPYTVDGFQTMWAKHRTRCGITGLAFRDIRRTVLKQRQQEHGIEAAQQMGAHGSVTTTERYTRSAGPVTVKPLR
jgi:integrase